MKVWELNGKLVVDENGKPIECDVCPCLDDCYLLRVAIKKRQQAINWGGLYIDVNDESYTIEEYQEFINFIAPNYVDGTYVGDVYDGPPALPNTYADAGETCAELLALVLDMQESIHSVAFVSGAGEEWQGTCNEPQPTCADVKNYLLADWHKLSTTTVGMVHGASYLSGSTKGYTGLLSSTGSPVRLYTNLINGTLFDHKYRFFAKSDTGIQIYEPLYPGFSLVSGLWVLWDSVDEWEKTVSWQTKFLPEGGVATPPAFCPCPAIFPNPGYYSRWQCRFQMDNATILIRWNFED